MSNVSLPVRQLSGTLRSSRGKEVYVDADDHTYRLSNVVGNIKKLRYLLFCFFLFQIFSMRAWTSFNASSRCSKRGCSATAHVDGNGIVVPSLLKLHNHAAPDFPSQVSFSILNSRAIRTRSDSVLLPTVTWLRPLSNRDRLWGRYYDKIYTYYVTVRETFHATMLNRERRLQ